MSQLQRFKDYLEEQPTNVAGGVATYALPLGKRRRKKKKDDEELRNGKTKK